jgi:hypothetical protein
MGSDAKPCAVNGRREPAPQRSAVGDAQVLLTHVFRQRDMRFVNILNQIRCARRRPAAGRGRARGLCRRGLVGLCDPCSEQRRWGGAERFTGNACTSTCIKAVAGSDGKMLQTELAAVLQAQRVCRAQGQSGRRSVAGRATARRRRASWRPPAAALCPRTTA